MTNKSTVQGRLTSKPEVRKTSTGKSVCNYTLACERDHSKAVDFINIVAWEELADISGNLRKGQLVDVEGRLQTRRYTDRDGNGRTATEIVASIIVPSNETTYPAEEFEAIPADDDLPF